MNDIYVAYYTFAALIAAIFLFCAAGMAHNIQKRDWLMLSLYIMLAGLAAFFLGGVSGQTQADEYAIDKANTVILWLIAKI